jgi:hypothetical protein
MFVFMYTSGLKDPPLKVPRKNKIKEEEKRQCSEKGGSRECPHGF